MRLMERMESDSQSMVRPSSFMIGYARVGELVAATFFTALVFGFYVTHYANSTGFFTSAFTAPLALLFFISVLFPIVNASAKALTPRTDIVALVELIGAALFVTVAAWLYNIFPLDFSHVADVVPTQFQFLFTWLTNDIGRIIVIIALAGGIIAVTVDSVKLAWRTSTRQMHKVISRV